MWVSSNEYLLLIIFFKKEQDNLFCTIISYCELKLKWIHIVFALNTRKGQLNS